MSKTDRQRQGLKKIADDPKKMKEFEEAVGCLLIKIFAAGFVLGIVVTLVVLLVAGWIT